MRIKTVIIQVSVHVLVVLSYMLVTPVIANAHVLESDNGISAVMHMPPDDMPQAGTPIVVDLSFSSSDTSFTLINYSVKVQAIRDGRVLHTADVTRKDGYEREARGTVDIPEGGAYTLTVSGQSLTGGQDFDLSYAVRVGGGTPAAKPGIDFWILTAGSWAILGIIAHRKIVDGRRYAR